MVPWPNLTNTICFSLQVWQAAFSFFPACSEAWKEMKSPKATSVSSLQFHFFAKKPKIPMLFFATPATTSLVPFMLQFPLVFHCASCNQAVLSLRVQIHRGQADFPFFLLLYHCRVLSTRGMRPPETITIQTLSAASSDSSRGSLAIPKYNSCFDHWTALLAGAKPGCSS